MGHSIEAVQRHLDFITEVFDALYEEFPSDCEVHWLSRTPEGQLKFHVYVAGVEMHAKCLPESAEALTDPVAFAKTIREQVDQFLANPNIIAAKKEAEEI